MKKKTENQTITFEAEAAVGDEIIIKNGGLTLIVKVGKDALIPDCADVLTRAVLLRPHVCVVAAQRVFHHENGAEQLLRLDAAEIRDELFAKIDNE